MTDSQQRPDLDATHQPPAEHSVKASVESAEAARILIQELEEQGVPPGAISMVGATPPEETDTNTEMPEIKAFQDTTRWVLTGGAVGALIGGTLGAVSVLVIPNLGLGWAIFFGALFGAAIGGAFGGMRVAQYNSPAWRETYETADPSGVEVGVHAGDAEIVDKAAEAMRRHGLVDVDRSEG